MDYYHAAANRSSPDALNGLGYLHFYGDEVERNLTTALSYFKRAAELGSGDGLVNAGLMLRGGMGCERNISEAYGYFVRCAAMNHQSCQYNAAMIEAAGEPELGIPRDCDRAAAACDKSPRLASGCRRWPTASRRISPGRTRRPGGSTITPPRWA